MRGVLLRPLVNRDEDRLIYIRQSAPAAGIENATFSVPEIEDLRARVRTISAFGDFSTIGFTMVGLGEPREVRAGVVGGTYFDVMGLRPVLGRLLDGRDDGAKAAGNFGPGFQFSADGHVRAPGEEDPRGRFRSVTPGFFNALRVPIVAGRDQDAINATSCGQTRR